MKITMLTITAVCTVAAGTALAEEKPNIILVMADDQGYGDMGYTGHPFVKTPNFDAMAKNSVVFDRFYSAAPVCSPTRASVMTGRHPMRVNVPHHGHYLRPHEHTVAEAMKDAGYVTGHFGKWHIGSVQPESPTSPGKVGFDEWQTGLNFYDVDPYFAETEGYAHRKGQGTTITMDSSIEFLKKHKDGEKPMFAVIWFPSPHDPHAELPEGVENAEELYAEAGKHQGYYQEIALMDQQMGKLRKSLRDMQIADNTIVWYCSDNGGLVKEYSGGRAKKGSIYEGGLRVPAMIEWPAKYQHKTISVPANTSDIYPTLVNLLGVKTEKSLPLDGVDLTPIIAGEQKTRSAMGFWHNYTGGQATFSCRYIKQLKEAKEQGTVVLQERVLKNVMEFPEIDRSSFKGHAAWTKWPMKLHRIENKKGVKVELYNLEKDPNEENNLAEEQKETADALLKELQEWQNQVFDSWEGKDYKANGIKL